MTRRIVLVGGGYVSLHACSQLRRRLRREIRRGSVELMVISADDCHNFHGFTGEVIAGLMPVHRTRTPLVGVCNPAVVVNGVVTAVDRHRRTVSYRPTAGGAAVEIAYDQLIVGSGSREPVDGVPGLAEHGYTLRSPGELERFVGAVERLVCMSNHPSAAGSPGPRVVVAGGGLAGVELAAAIADRGRGRLTVDLVHSGDGLLPALRDVHPGLVRRAERELGRLGVRVHRSLLVVRVTPEGAVLSDGTLLAANAVLGTIGQRPTPLPGLGREFRDDAGRLVTAGDLSVTEGVWSAGDAARVLHVTTGKPVPSNALWAIKGGAHVGANVARAVRGRRTRAFRYRGLGQAASFGVGRSIAELYGLPLVGRAAWVMRLMFFLRFLPSRRRVPSVLGDVGQALRGNRITASGRWVAAPEWAPPRQAAAPAAAASSSGRLQAA